MMVIAGIIVIFASSFIQGITSFGSSLIAVPLLSLFMDLKLVVPLLVIYNFVMNFIIFSRMFKFVKIKEILFMLICGIASTPIGALLLRNIDGDILKIFVGIIVLVLAGILLTGKSFKIRREKFAQVPVGIVSGLLNGSLSMGSPPVILFMSNQKIEKQVFRADLTAYFLALNITALPSYAASGLLKGDVLKYAVVFLPGLVAGTLSGMALSKKINEDIFRKFTLVLLLLMGFMSLLSGTKVL